MDWTEDEVKATVDDYLAMLAAEMAGQQYSKKAHGRALREKLNGSRSAGAFEFKHQNISAVMISLGLPYIRGYVPMVNIQGALAEEIQRRLEEDPGLFAALHATPGEAASGASLQPGTPPPPPRKTTRARPGNNGRGRHVDYGVLQEENRRRGELGERYVLGYEQELLAQAGCPDLASRVRWVAREDGDGLGYDIRSYDTQGRVRHIEVKATALGNETPFYLSSAELDFARRHHESYVLYRVYDVLAAPRFYVLEGDITTMIDMTPVTYRAWPLSANSSHEDA